MGATWRLRHSGKVEIEVVGALADAIATDERRWSRFIARSEVSRLNRAPGVPLQVSTETLDLLLSCDRWHEQTDGAFSVMVGGALIEYGYRESQRVRPPRTSRTPRPDAHSGRTRRRRRSAPPGLRAGGHALDLGGVARMWSAERAAAMVRTLSDDPAILLEVGDDMVAVRGDHLVAVSGVDSDSGGRAVVLRDGHALASSSWNALIWSNDDGAAAHHLIDPATGAPAEPASAVVIASDAGEADALATALAVRPELVSRLTTCAMVHTAQGERHTAPWEAVAV